MLFRQLTNTKLMVYTVRGYSEGLLIGRTGYTISSELLFQILPRTILSKDKTKRLPFVWNYLKGLPFIDYGMVFPYKGSGYGSEGIDNGDVLLSIGLGLRINLLDDVNFLGVFLSLEINMKQDNVQDVFTLKLA